MLTIDNVSKHFKNKVVLDQVSLQVPSGGIAILLGSSGVGKSTLLRILSGLEKADSGRIILNEKELDLGTITQTHVVGMVFQQFNLFDHVSVVENIAMPLRVVLCYTKEDSYKIAHQLLEQYGLEEHAHKSAQALSGGQRQRLALARTIALKPSIICLDEPTSALDPVLTKQVAQHILNLATQGYIVLIATHDTSLLHLLPARIYLMQNGVIVESADTEKFKENPESFRLINRFVLGEHHDDAA